MTAGTRIVHPTTFARSWAEVNTIEFGAVTGVQPVIPVVPSRATRHQPRARRWDRTAERIALGLGWAAFTALASLALYCWGWSG